MKNNFSFHILVMFIAFSNSLFANSDTLIHKNATWKYYDHVNTTIPNWKLLTYNDSLWASGAGQFGYGDGDEATVIYYGVSAKTKYIAYYFRKKINIANPAIYDSLRINMLCDDGAVIYLNGIEVKRTNLPLTTIGIKTRALTSINPPAESQYFPYILSNTNLIAGENIIAVEVHQYSSGNSDLSFDMQLLGFYSPCNAPLNTNATNITTNSSLISWNSAPYAVTYQLDYKKQTDTTWTSINAINDTSITIANLDYNTTYNYRVKTNCAAYSSSFTTINNFTTLTPVCQSPVNLNATNILTASGSVSWSTVQDAINYKLIYKISSASAWDTITSNDTSFLLNSLLPSSTYNWKVIAICAYGNSNESNTANFTTLTPCPATINNIASNITSNAATLKWKTTTGTGQYEVEYRGMNGQWITVTVNDTFLVLNSLVSATTYSWHVHALCAPGNTGAWSDYNSFTTSQVYFSTDTLIAKNATWKYLDNGSNQNTAWQLPSFVDAGWANGSAELGYGDGDEATIVSYGPSSSNKFITTYFRKTFSITNPSQYDSIQIGLVRDDGAVVYVNGVEVIRTNMPVTAINYLTLSPVAIAGTDESAYNIFYVSKSFFTSGSNCIAVEVHQQLASSSDISFNMFVAGVVGSPTINLVRGPYLQVLTPNSVNIRWASDISTNSKVYYGTDLSYGSAVDSATITTEHEIKLTGLLPNTKYYYTVGSSLKNIQGDDKNYFTTSLTTGSNASFTVWATGDFGKITTGQAGVKSAYLNYGKRANFWIWLGDNAYESGTTAEYNSTVFNQYPDIFKNTPVYPAPGNHDYANAGYLSVSALGTNFPYFNFFTVPTQAQAGGVASNSKKYYSYDFGNTHFISLDSYGALNNNTSAMYTWLQNDLLNNTSKFKVAYFHHPPYSMGTHNSDTETAMIDIRTNICTLLESYDVDLVLSGHSHTYERSILMHGNFGLENSISPAMKIDTSSGNNPFYSKSLPGGTGTVYAVCGISGKGGPGQTVQGSWPHAAMYSYSQSLYGSLILEINGDTLSSKLLTSTGSVFDQFKIVKSNGARQTTYFNNEEENDLTIFPNPFGDDLTVNIDASNDENVKIELMDITGRTIPFTEQRTIDHHQIISTISLPKNTPSGVILIKIINGSKIQYTNVYYIR